MLPIESIVAVLRDTPAIADVKAAIEVALDEETLIFSEIPDLAYTCEALNEVHRTAHLRAQRLAAALTLALTLAPPNPNPHEVLTLRDQRRRGTTNQTLELMSPEAREAAKRTTQAPQAPAQR